MKNIGNNFTMHSTSLRFHLAFREYIHNPPPHKLEHWKPEYSFWGKNHSPLPRTGTWKKTRIRVYWYCVLHSPILFHLFIYCPTIWYLWRLMKYFMFSCAPGLWPGAQLYISLHHSLTVRPSLHKKVENIRQDWCQDFASCHLQRKCPNA